MVEWKSTPKKHKKNAEMDVARRVEKKDKKTYRNFDSADSGAFFNHGNRVIVETPTASWN